MKKSTYHIIYSWALLLCFVTGQYMVYAHQHNQVKNIHASANHDCKRSSHTIVKEKCEICDSMHHNAMELSAGAEYHAPLFITKHTFKSSQYDFTSIALILAAGRAPPIAS
ncbi:hypothetical protein [Mucilaginibacter sp.]|uniref:hypothetical protein n=1 Tax=Mucilaginibacter sp. TaxID=1882438 RepID=UPI00326424C8